MEQRIRTEPILSTYLHGRGGKLGLAIGGNFELTARCNFRCPMCYVHLGREEIRARGRELTAGEWIDLARQARDKGMVFALLTGGEPFLREDFFEIYHAMKEMGLMISINTNGSLLSGRIREELIGDPPFRMNISLYGGCPETYRQMCGTDAFGAVVENIRAIREAGIDVRLNLSITRHNRKDLQRLFDLSRELDVHIKGTSYMYPSIRVNDGQFGCGDRLTPEEAAQAAVEWDLIRMSREQFAQRAKRLHELTGGEPRECSADPDEGVSCRAGHSSFWLTWDGRMLPCGMMPEPEQRPLEVGFDKAWEAIRKATREIRVSPECAACPKRELCASCAAVCVTETGAFEGTPEYMCRYTEELIRSAWSAYLEREEISDGD